MAKSKTTRKREKARRVSQKNRIDRRLEKLENKGITGSITYKGKSYTPKQLARKSEDFFNKAVKATEQQRRTAEAKRYAEYMGASPEEVKKIKSFKQATTFEPVKATDEGINRAYDNRVYTASKYLSVAWHDLTGERDLIRSIKEANRMSTEQLRKHIQELYQKAESDIDGSDDIAGVHQIARGDSREELERKLEELNDRGYGITESYVNGKLVNIPISTQGMPFDMVSIGNQFSERGMLALMYTIMSNSKNIMSKQFYDDMKAYTYNYCKPLYKKIFE